MGSRLRVNVKDSRFSRRSYVDWKEYGDIVSEDGTKLSWGDWTAEIRKAKKGDIICVEHASDQKKSRAFKLQDGVVFFDSYAYFRKVSYMKFVDRFGLDGVSHKNPNTYYTAADQEFVPVTSEIRVESDGEVTFGKDEYDRDTYWVSGATWAICWRHYGIPLLGGHIQEYFEGYLYTLEDDRSKVTAAMEEAGVSAPWWSGTAVVG